MLSDGYELVKTLMFFVVMAIILKASVVEAFKIPSSSMVPTLEIGDHILVVKFSYGTRIPFTDHVVKALGLREPRRGDVVVFRYPGNECEDYIKRIIGLPGDTVEVRNRRVFINGEHFVADGVDAELLQQLANQRSLSAEQISGIASNSALWAVWHDWYEQGWFLN